MIPNKGRKFSSQMFLLPVGYSVGIKISIDRFININNNFAQIFLSNFNTMFEVFFFNKK